MRVCNLSTYWVIWEYSKARYQHINLQFAINNATFNVLMGCN